MIKYILKIIWLIISLICIWIMGYYYIFLWYINPQTEIVEKIVYKEKIVENIIKEETFSLLEIPKEIINNNDNKFVSKKIVNFIENENRLNIDIELKIKDPNIINEFIGIKDFLIINDFIKIVIINQWNNIYKYDFIIKRNYEKILNLNWYIDLKNNFLYIDNINIDLIFEQINGYWLKNYKNNNFEYILNWKQFFDISEIISKTTIDLNFWVRQKDDFLNLLTWFESFIIEKEKDLNKLKVFSLKIDQSLKIDIIWSIFKNKESSLGQKQNYNDKLSNLINLLENTNIVLSDNFFYLINWNSNLIVDFNIKFKKNSNIISDDDLLIKEEYNKTTILDYFSNFSNSNSLLKIYMNNDFLIDILKKELK